MAGTFAPIQGRPQNLPYDVMTEQARLARKRKLVEALQLQAMKAHSPTFNAGKYEVPNFMDPVSKFMDARQAAAKEKELEAAEKASVEEQAKRTGPAVEDLVKSLMGYQQPGQPMTGGPMEQGPPDPGRFVPPDLAGGITRAYTSGVPDVKDVAHDFLKTMFSGRAKGESGPNFEKFMTAMKGQSPAAKQAAWENLYGEKKPINMFEPEAEYKVAGDVGVQVQGGQRVGPVDPLKNWTPPAINKDTGLPMSTETNTGESKSFTGGNVGVPTALAKDLGAAKVKQVEEGYKVGNNALDALHTISQSRGLVSSINPQMLGIGAEFKLNAAKLIETLGGPANANVANIETLYSTLGNLLLDKIRILAPVTKEDVQRMEKIAGSPNLTADGINQILDIAERRSAEHIQRHNAFVRRTMKDEGGAGAMAFYIGEFDPAGGAETITQGVPPIQQRRRATDFENLTPDQHRAAEKRLEELRRKRGLK